MLIDNSGKPLIPTARISVGNLRQDDHGDCREVEFSLADDANGLVRLMGQGRDSEVIVKGQVKLQFQFRGPFVPLGIAFHEEPPRNDPLGLKAFWKREITSANGTTVLTMTDDPRVEACFKFSLLYQLPDGQVRTLDPKIRNVPM